MSGERPLRLGFIALNCASVLIAAKEKGFFAAEGLDVELSRQVSWATVRDKMSIGALDGAHMLAPTALAISLGAAGGEPTPLIAPLALNINGPAITVASRLAAVMGTGSTADGLARLVARRREEGASPITLAVVFPFSAHNYLLRDWLARAGVDPDRDVRLTIAPPSRMTELLVGGVVEGFCVTEPWDAAAVAAGAGVVLVRGSQFWPRTPDKVFAVTETWAAQRPDDLQALLRAMIRAGAWADDLRNRAELAAILAQPHYVGADPVVIEASLSDMIFHADGAGAPQPIHAGWLLSQMMRWAHIDPGVDVEATARRVYRPDLYRTAAKALALPEIASVDLLEGFQEGAAFQLATAQAQATRARLSRISAG